MSNATYLSGFEYAHQTIGHITYMSTRSAHSTYSIFAAPRSLTHISLDGVVNREGNLTMGYF
jgi:hypothetical protein